MIQVDYAAMLKRRTDDGFVTAHRSFNQSKLAAVAFLLPAQSYMCDDGKNVPIPLRWVVPGRGTEHRITKKSGGGRIHTASAVPQ